MAKAYLKSRGNDKIRRGMTQLVGNDMICQGNDTISCENNMISQGNYIISPGHDMMTR